MQYFILTPTYVWLAIGVLFMLLEALGATGVGMVFGGIAGLITAVLIEANIVTDQDFLKQSTVWFALTIFFAIILYKPLKRWRTNPNAKDKFSNIVGDQAIVLAGGVAVGKPGKIRWSGTNMNAQIDPRSAKEAFLEGDMVYVTQIKGNQFLIADRDLSNGDDDET